MTTTPSPRTGAPAAPAPADSGRPDPAGTVYVVVGGDLVALFDNPEAADIMFTTMTGANLELEALRLSEAQWEQVRAVLAAAHLHITVTDARAGRDGGTR